MESRKNETKVIETGSKVQVLGICDQGSTEEKLTGRQELKVLKVLRTEKILNISILKLSRITEELELKSNSESRTKIFTAAMMGSE